MTFRPEVKTAIERREIVRLAAARMLAQAIGRAMADCVIRLGVVDISSLCAAFVERIYEHSGDGETRH
jgi:hypothetical protein